MADGTVAVNAEGSDSVSPLAVDLALSGGGVRAMAFHAGVLSFLAENNHLEFVRHLSTVSGGSLLIGLVFQEASMRWPTSAQYRATVLPAIRRRLTTLNLQRRAARQLLLPWNLRFVLSRANLFARAIKATWGVTGTLAQLPLAPLWSINGTTAETGKRFRFKSNGCGDYELGYADSAAFPLAQAMAVSAAFPGAIGPLTLQTKHYTWRKRSHWDADPLDVQVITPPFKRLRLYDGGLYDNLGLEPLFDGGQQVAKNPGARIILCDAGAPLLPGFTQWAINPFRFRRWLDLTMEQQRALRVRGFVNALRKGLLGAYLQIGSSAIDQLTTRKHAAAVQPWLLKDQASEVARYATSLARLSEDRFDLLCRHGYETAHWNNLAFPYLPATHAKAAAGAPT